MYKLNEIAPIELDSFARQPNQLDLVSECFKNIQYRDIDLFKVSSYCKSILSTMNDYIFLKFKYQHVFIQIQDLKVGDNTSGTGHWHLDSSLNADDVYENFIFVTGNHNTTEFLLKPITMPECKSSFEFDTKVKSMIGPEDSFYLKPLTIYKYTGSNVHRGRKVTVPEKRLLIRLSNTNKKLPIYRN